jgi:hypothetical protein
LDRERILRWLEQVYATSEAEIDCARLQELLPAYVELAIADGDGAEWAERVAQVQAHLAQCPDCAEEYEGLRAVAALESQGRLPTADESLQKFESTATYQRA